MHVNTVARINPADTPTAFVFSAGCWVSHYGTADAGLTLAFDGLAEARRWLEDAADAINDAEKARAKRLHPAAEQAHEEREQYLEARYEAESEGALDHATTPRVMPS